MTREMKLSIPDELIEDQDINKYLVEVYLNGNSITRGYEFSAKEKILYFLTSLLPSDVVTINLRNDFKLENDFTQNGAEILAFGLEFSNARAVYLSDNQLYCVLSGTSDYIAVNDPFMKLPYDEVILDREPPSGKA